MRASPEVRVLPDAAALFRAAADLFVQEAASAVGRAGSFSVALPGGSTPGGLYLLLAAEPAFRGGVDGARVEVFWGDERHVPPDHRDSNYRMAQEALLSKVPIPPDRVHRVRGEWPDAARVAADYENTLRACFRISPGERPRLDCVLLGLGADGHTASLFPGSDVLNETTRLVAAARAPAATPASRITLTLPVINRAACVIFLVSGEEKAGALEAVLEAPYDPRMFPAQAVRPESGRLIVLADRPAASLLQASASG